MERLLNNEDLLQTLGKDMHLARGENVKINNLVVFTFYIIFNYTCNGVFYLMFYII